VTPRHDPWARALGRVDLRVGLTFYSSDGSPKGSYGCAYGTGEWRVLKNSHNRYKIRSQAKRKGLRTPFDITT
jgi:hypothetical protein